MGKPLDYKDIVAKIRSYGYMHGVIGIAVDKDYPDDKLAKFFNVMGIYSLSERVRRDVFLECFVNKTDSDRVKNRMIFAYCYQYNWKEILFEVDLNDMSLIETLPVKNFFQKIFGKLKKLFYICKNKEIEKEIFK